MDHPGHVAAKAPAPAPPQSPHDRFRGAVLRRWPGIGKTAAAAEVAKLLVTADGQCTPAWALRLMDPEQGATPGLERACIIQRLFGIPVEDWVAQATP